MVMKADVSLTDRPQSVMIQDVSPRPPQHSAGLSAEPPPVHPGHTQLLRETPELSDGEVCG